MSTSLSCPSCGGEVRLHSFTPYVACSYCRHILVQVQDGYQDSGQVSGVADDISPFQIGSEGWFEGVHFGLVGRIRLAWKDGFWNEWYAYFDDGRFGWLAEAQGTLAILFESTDEEVNRAVYDDQLPAIRAHPQPLGQTIKINSELFVLSDIKRVECVVVEGETPRMSPLGEDFTVVDFMGNKGEIATAEAVPNPPKRRLFIGRYVEFEELRLGNLRELEGWPRR